MTKISPSSSPIWLTHFAF